MRKIALVGTASSGIAAPYDDLSWEIWGVSARASYVTRATRWFELHRLEGEPRDWANKWRETMKTFTHDVELFMFYPEHDLGPKVVQYPIDRIRDRFGTYFMTSSFAWMMALAIDELRPHKGEAVEGQIGIFGVEMEYATEYREQRNGFRHFIDLARVLNIPIIRLAEGGLAYEPVPYPFWQDDPLLQKIMKRQRENKQRHDTIDKSLHETHLLMAANAALQEELKRYRHPDYDPDKAEAALLKERQNLLKTSAGLSKEVTMLDGQADELAFFRDYLTP